MTSVNDIHRVLTQFKDESGQLIGTPFDLPLDINTDKLQIICNAVLENGDKIPYLFFVNDTQITETLRKTLESQTELFKPEKVLEIIYAPEAAFRVNAVTRCTSSIPGHAEAVISISFSPDGRHLASGSGDTTVRFWDVNTETPQFTCKGHKHWVLCISWAPNGKKLASACKNGSIMIWNAKTGTRIGNPLNGHKQWVNCLVWEPLHFNVECRRLGSASKDSTIRIWDVILQQTLITLSGHTQSVTSIKWGGTGLIYSASHDRTVKVWRPNDGVLCRTLEGHAHWVNTLALSTDYALRTGAFEPASSNISLDDISDDALAKNALERYQLARGECERLVSGSDDFTLFLWHPENEKKHVTRMTGHQQLINDVKFSPDTRLLASASFDKSIKLWDGKSGKFIASLRGHVKCVYQISWSADSRLLVSGSADSTLKVWNIPERGLLFDLPGHADEVYAIDWSPCSERVASGGKDKVLKM